MGTFPRLLLASASFSAWMLCLLVGWVAGGAVHLLLVAACLLFPWREEPPPGDGSGPASSEPGSSEPASSDPASSAQEPGESPPS